MISETAHVVSRRRRSEHRGASLLTSANVCVDRGGCDLLTTRRRRIRHAAGHITQHVTTLLLLLLLVMMMMMMMVVMVVVVVVVGMSYGDSVIDQNLHIVMSQI